MKTLKLAVAIAAVLSMLLIATPASGHTTDFWTCLNPSPQTSGQPADSDCTAHLHWTAKSDWLSVELPATAVMNHDENSAYPDSQDDPDDEQQVGQAPTQTNFSSDFNCNTSDDLMDGGTYAITWEDTWTTYTPPSGWSKVAEYSTTVLFVNIPTHVIYNPTSGLYRTETDLPTTLTCDGTPTNMNIEMWSHEGNNGAAEWVGKNPTTAGNHTVTATVTLVGGATHSDSATITTT